MKLLVIVLALMLSGCQIGYRVKSDSVVWVHWNEGTGRVEQTLERARPGLFRRLSDSYGATLNYVYYEATLIGGANPSTFLVLSDTYSRDKTSLYFMGRKVDKAQAESIVILGTNYAADDFSVFYRRSRIIGAKPDNFSIEDFENSEVYSCYLASLRECEVPYVQ